MKLWGASSPTSSYSYERKKRDTTNLAWHQIGYQSGESAVSDRRPSASDARRPTLGVGVLTCLEPRVDPAAFGGLRLSEAIVLRNAGGRVTAHVIADLAWRAEAPACGRRKSRRSRHPHHRSTVSHRSRRVGPSLLAT